MVRAMDDFSWIALIVGALAFFLLGAIWYTFLFRKPWMADMGMDSNQAPQSPGPQPLIGSFVAALVLTAAVEYLVGGGGVKNGVCTGIAVGAAVAAVMGQNALYDPRPIRLWVINAGYAFVGTVLVGVIAGAIQA